MQKNYDALQIINYITNNYITLADLAKKTALDEEKIQALIIAGCIPTYSHKITEVIIFQTDVFGNDAVINNEKFYYHPSLIQWIKKAEDYSKENLSFAARKMRENFSAEFRLALAQQEKAHLAFPSCFDEENKLIESELEKIIAEKWHYVMNGTYGVCLKEITATNIVIKAIAVALLEQLLVEPELNELIKATNLYDEVSAEFAPNHVDKSSRGLLYAEAKKKISSYT